MDELMNVKDTAQYLKLNYMTVYKLAQRRQIPAIKVGGGWRFKKEIIDDWLLQNARVARETVLVVDDDQTIRDILQTVIEKQGYTVLTADSGESALKEIDKRHFDLVFLDLRMPGMSGIDVLDAVKEKAKDIVIVIVTGHADEPIALTAMSKGPLLLVRKPFRERDIIEVLNIVMKGKHV